MLTRRQFFGFAAGAAALAALPVKLARSAYDGIRIRYFPGRHYVMEIDAGGASMAEVYDYMKPLMRREANTWTQADHEALLNKRRVPGGYEV